ncbi:MAG: GNAT family N-acetyltransferase [Myxococcota bacterium]
MIRVMQAGDWPALVEVLGRAFNLPDPARWATFRERIGDGNFRVAIDGDTLVGGLGCYPLGQWFGGRSVPMGGLAAVGVAPERRGEGVAARMVADTLRWLRETGRPLAGLYASTQHVYRSVGFEQAGNRVAWSVPLDALHAADRSLVATRVEAPPRELYRPAHGNLDRSEAIWQRIAVPREGTRWFYRLGDDGYVVLGHEGDQHYDVVVFDHATHTPEAARRFWSLLADHRSLGKNARWFGPANEPLLALLPEMRASAEKLERWMLRVTDVPRALAMRGYAANGVLDLSVDDPLLPENTGRWQLVVQDGEATVSRGGRGTLLCGPRGLGPLYSGLFDAWALRAIGLVDGDDNACAAAARLFGGPEPFMREMY